MTTTVAQIAAAVASKRRHMVLAFPCASGWVVLAGRFDYDPHYVTWVSGESAPTAFQSGVYFPGTPDGLIKAIASAHDRCASMGGRVAA